MSINLSFDQGAAIVIGGTGGIGEAICKRFAEAGAPVVFTYHSNQEKAQSLKKEIDENGGECEYAQVNLSDSQEVDDFFTHTKEKYNHVAHVVYAAGPHFDFNFIGAIPNEQWQHVVNADINGAFYTIQNAVNLFRAQGNGSGNLIAIITCAVECVPIRDIMSAAPKAAIEMLIRGVAKESGRFGIRANCVGPGWINAGLGKKGLEEQLTPAMVEKLRKTAIPLQKFGQADDIAYAVLFLCSLQAGFISGQSLAVDGGAQI